MLKQIIWWLVVVALVVLGIYLWNHRFGEPEHFVDPADEFKYGSIGSDHPMAMAPIPYWILKALPAVAPPSTVIPEMYAKPWNGENGFAAFGLVTEEQMPTALKNADHEKHLERPIGFSRRTVLGMDFVGVNCAFCHLTTYRNAPDDKIQTVIAGTGNAVNIQQFFLYAFQVLGDKELFNADRVMSKVDDELDKQKQSLGWFQRLIYRYLVIPILPRVLESRKNNYFDFIAGTDTRLEPFGPGRVDTWAAYRRLYVDPPQRQNFEGSPPKKVNIQGIVDFPPFWNGKARTGMRMHWDGNIGVPEERNIVSALAVIGENLDYLDFPRVQRIADFANELMPPRYADRIPENVQGIQHDLVARGESVFQSRCATCHAPGGERIGTVERLEDIGTDDQRHLDFTRELADGLNRLGTDQWKLRNFAPQHGYVNNLLDGIWLRAPYLHNGSVPTLRDLLSKPADRPTNFCTGNNVYDWANVGFRSAMVASDAEYPCGRFFHYQTSVTGNSNAGHDFGTDLEASDKDALIEFLKTL